MRKFQIYGALLTLAVLFFIPLDARADIVVPEDDSSAVILAYNRIGEDAYPDNSLRTDQFMAHLGELTRGEYTVMALPDIISAVQNGETLPPKTVAITFAGAYKSILTNAIPALVERGLPFTVFYASDHADADVQQHLNWDDLRTLRETGLVTFGLLPAAYTRLAGESDEEILRQINKARTRHREELGLESTLFSYPFGEHSKRYKDIIRDQGFTAAFGLHSGAIHPGADFYALPRFSMTQSHGDTERFQLVANALPLTVSDIEPHDPYLTADAQPAIGFTISETLASKISALSCFVSGQSQPGIEKLGKNRIELRLAEPLTEERVRINCTIPARKENGTERWRWLGMLLVNKVQDEASAAGITPSAGELP